MTTESKQLIVLDGVIVRRWGGKFVEWKVEEEKALLQDFYSWLAARGLSYAGSYATTSRK